MSYRKLDVDGRKLRYTVGKKFVKVQDTATGEVMLFETALVGNPIGDGLFVVTPRNVRQAVLGRPLPMIMFCDEHNFVTTEFAFDPFDYEIYGKGTLVMNCPKCLEERAMEI